MGTGAPSALIGVMVAAALMPPLVTMGVFLGEGLNDLATGALLLLLVNIVCINLSGVATFLLMGLRPGGEESTGSRRTAVVALAVLVGLTLLLAYLISVR